MSKIIFINRFFYPDQSATSQILSDLLFNISDDLLRDVYVVTSRNEYQGNMRLPQTECINNINVHRVWTSNFGRGSFVGRTLDYMTFYISSFFYLMRIVGKGDIVVAKTDPPMISIVVWLVVKLKRAVLINWIQDLFPEVAAALSVIHKKSILYLVFKRLKNISVRAADYNVVIGERMKDKLLEEGCDSNKIKVIDNWNINHDEKYINKRENYLIDDWALKDKFVIGYSGNFGFAHVYESVRKMMQYFSSDKSVFFLFIGGGKYYDKLKEYVSANQIPNVIFKPYQDKDKLSYSLSVADIQLISLVPELEGLIVPSKFYGLAAIGSPMIFIGDVHGEIGSVLDRTKSGYVVSPDNVEGLISIVSNLMSNPESSRDITDNLKSLYHNNYRPDISYKKWKNLLLEFA